MTKKELGGFIVELSEDGEEYGAKVILEIHDAPKGAILGGVMMLIARLTELNPKFQIILEEAMAEHLAGNLKVRRVAVWDD